MSDIVDALRAMSTALNNAIPYFTNSIDTEMCEIASETSSVAAAEIASLRAQIAALERTRDKAREQRDTSDLLRLRAEEQVAVAKASLRSDVQLPQWVNDFLNRRTDVENRLRKAARAGESISPNECLTLANKLGVPSSFPRGAAS